MQERVTYTKITVIEKWENVMHEWIDQLAQQLKTADERKARMEREFTRQQEGLWEDSENP
ncbi:MAG: hypothetical protein AABN95_08365 [Acidobacteriota bacterium]